MTYKPNHARLARLEAGSRPPMPGQDPQREEEIRVELVEELRPRGRVEQMWIEDIAYRVAAIEVIRAQIAGLRMTFVVERLENLARQEQAAREQRALLSESEFAVAFEMSPSERVLLDRWSRGGITPQPLSTFLGDPMFASLAGRLDGRQANLLRLLQIQEHEEVRERDRIINQFERRRRQEVFDAIELANARRRAGLAELVDESDCDGNVIGSVDAEVNAGGGDAICLIGSEGGEKVR